MMRQKLQLQLAINQPSLKDYQIIKYVNKYVDAVMKQIARQFLTVTSDELEAGEFSYAADDVYKQCGQAMIAGERVRIYTMMQSQPTTSLVIHTYTGNSISKRVSKVTFNQKYKKDILKDLMTVDYLLNDSYLDSLACKANYVIPVDMGALDSYIENTKQTLVHAKSLKYVEKLLRNLSAAKQIKTRAVEKLDGTYVTNEYWETIDSGRMHGHGLSLQRVAKEVRHAVLGRCAKIDFKASSYAIFTSLALAINPTIKVAALTHYIQKRTIIRKRIAKKIGVSEEWMKTIFTSLGFGAELKNNPFSSIRRKLGKEKYAQLIANTEFMEIKNALDVVRDTVLTCDVFQSDAFKIGNQQYSAIDSKTEKKRSTNQKLAWIYQASERYALDIVISKLPHNYDMLLPVHDCIYVKQSLTSNVGHDLKFEMREIFPLLDFEQELVFPIHAAADHQLFNGVIAAEEAQHKKRMAEEEVAARGYVSKFNSPELPSAALDYHHESNVAYEQRRRLESLLSLEKYKTEQKNGYYGNNDSYGHNLTRDADNAGD